MALASVSAAETHQDTLAASPWRHRLYWRVEAELDVSRCPDWSEKLDVVVTPER